MIYTCKYNEKYIKLIICSKERAAFLKKRLFYNNKDVPLDQVS